MARVFFKKDVEKGRDQVHVVGRPDVVREISDGLESPQRELHTWYIGQLETVDEEREAVLPALEELVRSVPVPIIGDHRAFVEEALGLPLKAGEAQELVQALEGFVPGKQTKQNMEKKEA